MITHPTSVPIDGDKLTAYAHSRGVNMRCLGALTMTLEKLEKAFPAAAEYPLKLCKQEMIARAAKSLLRDLLKDIPLYLAPQCIARFFNCLFADPKTLATAPATRASVPTTYLPAPFQISAGTPPSFASATPPSKAAMASLLPAEVSHKYETMTPQTVDSMIRTAVYSKFRYPGSKLSYPRLVTERHVPLLRSICKKVGIQLLARVRDWEAGAACFSASDMLNLYPIVKSPEMKVYMYIQNYFILNWFMYFSKYSRTLRSKFTSTASMLSARIRFSSAPSLWRRLSIFLSKFLVQVSGFLLFINLVI